MEERTKKRHFGRWMFLLLLVSVVVGAVWKGPWIYDYYRAQTYQPSSEMMRIRESLNLTEQGEFLFNASQPELDSAADFNTNCQSNNSETAVLGCYTMGTIYVYNIDSAELDGIRELTTAHELLHAVWARMSEEEKSALNSALAEVRATNSAKLDEEIGAYDASESQEELYVRAGTEVANLPDVLERHYAEVFRDQDAVVAYYDRYIGVFQALQTELDGLAAEMETAKTTIDLKTKEYEKRSEQLNADIVSFNSCAEVVGCFETEAEFSAERAELVAEQEALEVLYEELNGLITDYNAKVEQYNAGVTQGEKLNTLINSNAKPKEVE
jgi:hypothetical protein